MNHVRVRTAVSPLRRRFPGAATPMPSVDELIAMERPEEPMHCLRPATVEAAARAFAEVFPGDLLYAVKANPEPAMLRAVHAGGVTHFDCASIGEIALVRQMFPDAAIHFMHPVKSRGAIREAWQRHGVRDFVLDSAEELAKILHETAATCVAGELGLIVRLALPKGPAVLDLSGKFGAEPAPAADLLRAARPHAARLGLSFHVGSQCPEPLAWRRALALVGEVISDAGVAIEVIDVGGGFPVRYPDVEVPPLGAYLAEIEAGFERLGRPEAVGRARPRSCRQWRIGGRAGAVSARQCAVHQRRRLRCAGGCRSARLSLSGTADPPRWTDAIRCVGRLRVLRADLRQCRCDARAVPSACRCGGGRLDRDRSARRIWRLSAHRVQRLRPRAPRRGARRFVASGGNSSRWRRCVL
jgi:hypothetical protein